MVAKNNVKDIESYFEKQMLARTAAGWNPETEPRIAGTVVSIVKREDGEYDPYPIVVLEKPDGSTVAVHAFHQMLQQAFKDARTVIGSNVIVQSLGKRAKRDGSGEYNMYFVADADALLLGEETSVDAPYEF